VVETPGYLAAQAAITAAQASLTVARQAADASIAAANATFKQTQTAQTALVAATQEAVTKAGQGVEAASLDSARLALQRYLDAQATVIASLNVAITAVKNGAEAAALQSAQTALADAQKNVKDIDVARAALDAAQTVGEAVTEAAEWIDNNVVDILDIRTIQVEADLRGVVQQGTKLTANISGTFAKKDVEFSMDFQIGGGDQLCKDIFNKFMADIQSGAFKF
jgi:hypothetical protein